MYFNFDDNRPDTPRIVEPISRREAVLLTINLHALIVIAILLGPKLPWVQQIIQRQQQALEEQQKAQLERQRDQARFVFVQPKLDRQSPKPPPVAELSDLDRRARTTERAPNPTNPMPFARGNSPERVESDSSKKPMPGEQPQPQPQPQPQAQTAENNGTGATPPPPMPQSTNGYERPDTTGQTEARGPAVGTIANAIKNVRRYATENFGNLRGGQDQQIGESIQFDSKGVEFGPWLARFVAQVRSNWMIPQAAMSMHGNVVITFFVHKNGRITDVMIARPSAIDAFNLSARNAILTSNPTIPLPPEYPDDKAFFTVTFFFNETPPGR
jgi:TonB family protein